MNVRDMLLDGWERHDTFAVSALGLVLAAGILIAKDHLVLALIAALAGGVTAAIAIGMAERSVRG